ncbi:MAG: Ni/Fe hydrogenase subunit alpha, partial [Microcoleaceae cyanobacterium]
MGKTVVIDPVTRIEGHAKISIYLDDAGEVNDARFHVVEFRGFEKFCEGRPFTEMAGITARICGICPVSHLLASAKTGDKVLAVKVPIAGEKLRRMMNLAQFTQSHALSFFHLSSPDFLLGWDSDPATRNVFGLMAANPDLARAGIRLRQFGQQIIELLGARKIHAAWAVPGGVRSPLSEEGRAWIRERLPESRQTLESALNLFKRLLDQFKTEVENFGEFPSLFMGLVAPNGNWEHYGGHLRFMDSDGNIVADGLSEDNYRDFLGEAVETWSYLKFPYYKPLGYPDGIYRVGPLARVNICDRMGVPHADAELIEFRQRAGARVATSSFFYHYARLLEILACLEFIEQLVNDDDIASKRCRADAGVNQLNAV